MTPCPAGTYLDAKFGSALTDCKQCIPGYECPTTNIDTPTSLCPAGFYCDAGTTTASTQCPIGSYCPIGSEIALLCPPGTYANAAGSSSCTQCPLGYFCPLGTGDYTTNPCPAGYYCPLGTELDTQYPCPIGTFNTLTGQDDLADCLPCTAGKYCPTIGTSTLATNDCQQGFFCLAGSTRPIPQSVTFGSMCVPGQYCPTGSGAAVSCDAGSYCRNYLLTAVSGQCAAGYYCPGGGKDQYPNDLTAYGGTICPVGNYCPIGSTAPTQCAAGTYLNS